MPRLTISVALCTYNGEKYLSEQLDSIVRQTRQPDELVVCDDGSTDRTVEVVDKFSATASFPVRLFINEQRLGSSRNFGRAIELCQGDVIALSDQDDVWTTNKLASMESFFDSQPDTDALFSDAEIVDQSLQSMGCRLWDVIKFSPRERREVQDGNAIRTLLRHNVVTGAAMAFRRQLCPLLLPIPVDGVHDAWIALLIAAAGHLRSLPQPLILYRQHSDNQIGARRRSLFEQMRRPCERAIREAQAALSQYEQATERLRRVGPTLVVDAVFEDFVKKVEHVRRRIAIALREPGWLTLMFAEIARGRYHRYSVGWWSVAHDFIKCSMKQV